MIRRQIIDLARRKRSAPGGRRHPSLRRLARHRRSTPTTRYHTIVEDMKMVARANLIFGLHVHIGVEDRETAIQIMNAARYFLPHILALSTNSPFWLGMDTGLEIVPLQGLRQIPAHQHPRLFTPSWSRIRELHQPADQDQLHR